MPADIARRPARDLSPDEAEERAERCFALDQAVKTGLRQGREAMWQVASAAYEFNEEHAWSALGYENLGEWLADPDVGMTRSTYSRFVSAYRELVVHRQLPMGTVSELDVSKVDIVMSKVRAGSVRLDDAIEDVKALGWRDLREKYMRRPDPADEQGVDDDPSAGTRDAAGDDDDVYVSPPVNDGTDEPQWAADVGDVVDDDIPDAEVVEEPEEPAQNDHTEASGPLRSESQAADPFALLDPLIEQAKEALTIPQRIASSPRIVRTMLIALIDGIEEARS